MVSILLTAVVAAFADKVAPVTIGTSRCSSRDGLSILERKTSNHFGFGKYSAGSSKDKTRTWSISPDESMTRAKVSGWVLTR